MEKIGIFFGSDTGNTEKVAKKIFKKMNKKKVSLYDISTVSRKIIEKYKILILGIPTWYYGDLQCDWDDFIPILKKISFKKKIVALFGCGDQEDYSEYFCDAMYKIYKILKKNNAIFIGKWPSKDYKFDSSKALYDKNNFIGLIIDEDRQPEKSEFRINLWIKQLLLEIKKCSKNI
ncbi:flavodoxin FldA [Buchnera aphidicola (Ceratoglyphina bambusae)]|uniref:flavodoxin FldA n=1 Tax=Buchnera aphidicola TaxID=9 RepID=UPI0031B87D4F